VSENSYNALAVHKCDCNATDTPLDWCSSARRREQLIAEIGALQAQLDRLGHEAGEVDFSTQQTCREMIHSRQQLFLALRR